MKKLGSRQFWIEVAIKTLFLIVGVALLFGLTYLMIWLDGGWHLNDKCPMWIAVFIGIVFYFFGRWEGWKAAKAGKEHWFIR